MDVFRTHGFDVVFDLSMHEMLVYAWNACFRVNLLNFPLRSPMKKLIKTRKLREHCGCINWTSTVVTRLPPLRRGVVTTTTKKRKTLLEGTKNKNKKEMKKMTMTMMTIAAVVITTTTIISNNKNNNNKLESLDYKSIPFNKNAQV